MEKFEDKKAGGPDTHRESSPSEKELIINALRKDGIENPKVKEMLILWVTEQEEKVNSNKNKSEFIEARINLEIEKAKIYYAGGYKDEAYDTLNEAMNESDSEDRPDLTEKIQNEIRNFGQ